MSKTSATTTSDLTHWACGGTGINICALMKANPTTRTNKESVVIGLDSSDKNNGNDLFPIERLEGVRGAGKDANVIMELAKPFVTQVLAKYKPTRFNIITVNISGGSGRGIAFWLARELLAQGHIVMFAFVSDQTSFVEKENSVKHRRSFANIVSQLDVPVCYMEFPDNGSKTRGQINNEVLQGLALASVFFNSKNTEMDDADILNFFYYSNKKKVPPALSRVTFFGHEEAKNYNEKTPVAVASLFEDNDSVIQLFPGTVYRTTGIMDTNNNPPANLTELHMTLDHGEALEKLEQEMRELDDDRAGLGMAFTKQKDVGQGADDFGFI